MDISKTYRFIPASNPPAENKKDLVGIRRDGNVGFTDYVGKCFYPSVTHYLAKDESPFDRYAEAASSETIEFLEGQLESLESQTIQQLIFNDQSFINQAFIEKIGKALMEEVREQYITWREDQAFGRNPTYFDRKKAERTAIKIIEEMKRGSNGL